MSDTTEARPEVGKPRRRGVLRRLYDWMLHWADTRYGPVALFLLAMAESSFFPIPPDPLLIALCLGAVARSWRFAAICTVGSVVGGIIGYGIGAGAWQVAEGWFFAYVPGVDEHTFGLAQGFYDRYDFWAVFLGGFTVIPYKVFTLLAGVFSINFGVFVIASAVSRGLRFFLVAALIHHFGTPIAAFIDKYFDWLALAFAVLLVGGFLAFKVVL